MSWLPWRRPSPAPQVTPPSPPPVEEEPEPPRPSFVEKIARWRAVFAEQRQAQPSRDALEQAQEQARRQRTEAMENEIARSIAFKGMHWPGEGYDEVPSGPPGGLFADRGADFDWRARVDAAQAQDVAAGGRGPA